MSSTLLCLLLVLLSLSLFSTCTSTESWSINCGSTDGLNETSTRITWVGDGNYARSGKSFPIPEANGTPFGSLRSFPRNKKNCYTIPVGIDRKILVTARFYYGNYDKVAKPPTFELMFDTSYWSRVGPHNGVVDFKVIYVTKRNDTSICVGRLFADQDPFMSAIDVRVLEPEMYGAVNSSFALIPWWAVAFGANSGIGFPEDPYNRRWYLANEVLGSLNHSTLGSSATYVNVSTSMDYPPEALFKNAAAAISGSGNLTIKMARLPSLNPPPIYLNMYFSEVVEPIAGDEEKRSFHIYMDDTLLTRVHGPVVPPYLSVKEIYGPILGVTNNTTFTLVPTPDSTLCPIINGMEVLIIPGPTAEGTYNNDVEAVMVLRNSFEVLHEWSGDPCLPRNYGWEWVNCSFDTPPRITTLWLSDYGLVGGLPDFRGLDALEIIDLHYNNLTGKVPEFLSQLPKLRELNLAYNNFSGIQLNLFHDSTAVNTTGNPLLEASPSPSPSAPSPTGGEMQNMMSCTTTFCCVLLLLIAGMG